jgi:hypothetical protein
MPPELRSGGLDFILPCSMEAAYFCSVRRQNTLLQLSSHTSRMCRRVQLQVLIAYVLGPSLGRAFPDPSP